MKLKVFKEKERKKYTIYIFLATIIILMSAIFLYRTYSIYQESQEFDVIKGNVPDQNYDIMFIFYLVDENGMKSMIETVPEGKNYQVEVTCNHDAKGRWDKENWGPVITNFTNTRTKCGIIFEEIRPLKQYGIKETVVEEGSGLYEVPHKDAMITGTDNETIHTNLKMTEYRYAGSSPNNYVTFNGELWRMIGLVNTPEGQRIKLIRHDSIGNFSWDSSGTGYGVNVWNKAHLKDLLNFGHYYNQTSGTCYNGPNYASTACNFTRSGLNKLAREMIDSITWSVGKNENQSYDSITVGEFYNLERSGMMWKGQVGLMNPSDYGYATSGGELITRSTCLSTILYKWSDENISECKENNWLFDSTSMQWSINPMNYPVASHVFHISSTGGVGGNYASSPNYPHSCRPSIYLKESIKLISGFGTKENPYILKAE